MAARANASHQTLLLVPWAYAHPVPAVRWACVHRTASTGQLSRRQLKRALCFDASKLSLSTLLWKHNNMRATALCLLIAALWACAAGQCHTPDVGNVGSEAQLSVDACAINDALKTSPPDYATARAIYTSGRSSKSPTLQGVATGSFPTNLWRRFASFYGDDSWMNTAIVNALDGSPPFTTDARRVKVRGAEIFLCKVSG